VPADAQGQRLRGGARANGRLGAAPRPDAAGSARPPRRLLGSPEAWNCGETEAWRRGEGAATSPISMLPPCLRAPEVFSAVTTTTPLGGRCGPDARPRCVESRRDADTEAWGGDGSQPHLRAPSGSPCLRGDLIRDDHHTPWRPARARLRLTSRSRGPVRDRSRRGKVDSRPRSSRIGDVRTRGIAGTSRGRSGASRRPRSVVKALFIHSRQAAGP